MKFLFILSEYLPDSGGGIISYCAGVLPRIAKAGHDVNVVVASNEFADHPTLLINGVQFNYLKTEFFEKFQKGFERFQIGHPTFAAFLPVALAANEQS